MSQLPPPPLPQGVVRVNLPGGGSALLAEEVPVALVFDGVTQAVMMATPCDLPDFLLGFALTEGMIDTPAEVLRSEVVPQARGIELRAWLATDAARRFAERRRGMAGPVGCGLCGIESLAATLRPLPVPKTTPGRVPVPEDVAGFASKALAALRAVQPLHDAVRATHAAGFWRDGKIWAVREDVGRHNAFDKLAGAMAAQGLEPGLGAIVLTSRISVDLVQKAAIIGAGLLISPSAPTALALTEAQAAGIALVARGPEGPVLFTHPEETP